MAPLIPFSIWPYKKDGTADLDQIHVFTGLAPSLPLPKSGKFSVCFPVSGELMAEAKFAAFSRYFRCQRDWRK